MYKAIIFDIDDTLLNFGECMLYTQNRVSEEYSHEISDWDAFWNTFIPVNIDYWERKRELQLSREQIIDYSFQDTLRKLNLNLKISKVLSDTYWESFCNICVFEPFAKEVVEKLSKKYKLGVITNGLSDSQRKRLEVCGIHRYFHSVIISDEVGYYKPEPQIFDLSLTELEVENHEVLFIGDSLSDDLEGAKNAEIDFCLYNKGNKSLPSNREPKYIINHLGELIDIL